MRTASEGGGMTLGSAGLTQAQVDAKINRLVNYVKSIQVQ
jgi:hypothetical protein